MTTTATPGEHCPQELGKTLNDQLIRVWDIYIRFHSLWLAANLVGLGIQVEKLTSWQGKLLFALAFSAAHVLASVSSLRVREYTRASCDELAALGCASLAGFRSLGLWSGKANVSVYVAFVAIWIGSVFVP